MRQIHVFVSFNDYSGKRSIAVHSSYYMYTFNMDVFSIDKIFCHEIEQKQYLAYNRLESQMLKLIVKIYSQEIYYVEVGGGGGCYKMGK